MVRALLLAAAFSILSTAGTLGTVGPETFRDTHDKEPFTPFGKVVAGLDVADALFDEYGEAAGGGIRAGRQDPLFQGGNEYLKKNFPKLDYIRTARVIQSRE